MTNARDIARYFLGTFEPESGDNISNLKLQKLLYYAQGFHVAMHDGEPMFSESVEAWQHGPVVRSLYHEYSKYGWRAIDQPQDFDLYDYLPEDRELLDAVYLHYGQFSAKHLEWMTHQERPWKETPQNNVISSKVLREYFTEIVNAGRSGKSVPDHPVWPTSSFRFQDRKTISNRIMRHRGNLLKVAKAIDASPNPWAGDI